MEPPMTFPGVPNISMSITAHWKGTSPHHPSVQNKCSSNMIKSYRWILFLWESDQKQELSPKVPEHVELILKSISRPSPFQIPGAPGAASSCASRSTRQVLSGCLRLEPCVRPEVPQEREKREEENPEHEERIDNPKKIHHAIAYIILLQT